MKMTRVGGRLIRDEGCSWLVDGPLPINGVCDMVNAATFRCSAAQYRVH
jgi:hypothetical protein